MPLVMQREQVSHATWAAGRLTEGEHMQEEEEEGQPKTCVWTTPIEGKKKKHTDRKYKIEKTEWNDSDWYSATQTI